MYILTTSYSLNQNVMCVLVNENECMGYIATGEWGVPPSGGGEGSPHQTTQVRGGGEKVGGSYWKPVLPLRHARLPYLSVWDLQQGQ